MLDMGLEARIHPAWIRVYLKPTEMHISNGDPQAVTTVLGSCVTVTFFAPKARIGAITHALLPKSNNQQGPENAGRFVDSSIKWAVWAMHKQGIKPAELEVKLFGGAQMYSYNASDSNRISVGRQNVQTALQIIEELDLRLAVSEVGGNSGRKLIFFPHMGEVWIKKLNRTITSDGVANG